MYGVNFRNQSECKKDGPEKTPYLNTFNALYILLSRYSNNRNLNLCLHNNYLPGGLVF